MSSSIDWQEVISGQQVLLEQDNKTDKWYCALSPSVTNDLLPQSRYSIRGLAADTEYHLKITAHNQAGSTSSRLEQYHPSMHSSLTSSCLQIFCSNPARKLLRSRSLWQGFIRIAARDHGSWLKVHPAHHHFIFVSLLGFIGCLHLSEKEQ